jgi:hypothetical protein
MFLDKSGVKKILLISQSWAWGIPSIMKNRSDGANLYFHIRYSLEQFVFVHSGFPFPAPCFRYGGGGLWGPDIGDNRPLASVCRTSAYPKPTSIAMVAHFIELFSSDFISS